MVLERVQKTISNAGYCSRRNAEVLISDCKVKVNGKIIKLGDKADLEKDKIEVEGNILNSKPKKIYLMLNKPKFYVTTTKDPFCKKTVMDLIYEKERVYPVGRLDALTTGLLLLTNDGDFANKIMHPRYETKKTYLVTLNRPLLKSDMAQIEDGLSLPTLKTGHSKIEYVEKASKNIISMTIHEGQNKEIKRIFKLFEYHIDELQRIAIKDLKLDVELGRYRFLTQKEVDKLLSDTKVLSAVAGKK
jgi:23S rRNA pseudouridine2605 synthase